MKSKETNSILEKLRARVEGAIPDRASDFQPVNPPPPAVAPVVVTQVRQEFKPETKLIDSPAATATQQGNLFPRSKRSDDGVTIRFTDDELQDIRRAILSAAIDLNLNLTLSDHIRICHHYFKRRGAKITPEMVQEVRASDRRRHKKEPGIRP